MGNRESFEANMRRRIEAIRHMSDHSIFNELRGTIIDYNYDKKSLTMEFYAGDFHRNGFNIMFGGSLVGMFDITFGTLTSGLGDYDIAPTVQLSTSFLKGDSNWIHGYGQSGGSIYRKNNHEFYG